MQLLLQPDITSLETMMEKISNMYEIKELTAVIRS